MVIGSANGMDVFNGFPKVISWAELYGSDKICQDLNESLVHVQQKPHLPDTPRMLVFGPNLEKARDLLTFESFNRFGETILQS